MRNAKEVYGTEETVVPFCFWFTVLQALIGAGLYISNDSHVVMVNALYAMNPYLNFIGKAHLFANAAAMLAMVIGYLKFKKPEAAPVRLKNVSLYYGSALVLMLIGIPWKYM
jgi:hypothetical protein